MFATVSSSRLSRIAPGREKPTQAASVLHTGEIAGISDKMVKVQMTNGSTVTIDPTPAFITLAWFITSEGPVVAIRERVTF